MSDSDLAPEYVDEERWQVVNRVRKMRRARARTPEGLTRGRLMMLMHLMEEKLCAELVERVLSFLDLTGLAAFIELIHVLAVNNLIYWHYANNQPSIYHLNLEDWNEGYQSCRAKLELMSLCADAAMDKALKPYGICARRMSSWSYRHAERRAYSERTRRFLRRPGAEDSGSDTDEAESDEMHKRQKRKLKVLRCLHNFPPDRSGSMYDSSYYMLEHEYPWDNPKEWRDAMEPWRKKRKLACPHE